MTSDRNEQAPNSNDSIEKLPALRIVHLDGGLRAVDFGKAQISIHASPDVEIFKFSRVPYAQLYPALNSLNLNPIGVEFINSELEFQRIMPMDWQVATNSGQFVAMHSERAWSDVRHVPEQKSMDIQDIAGRFATYHRLVAYRIKELSEAYSKILRSTFYDFEGRRIQPKPASFANGYIVDIEAAIHAFLADAAAFRDLLAESTWNLVLNRETKDVTTLSSFLKKTKNESHALVQSIQEAGKEGGWLKVLTDLRNSITHIAPVANTHELHSIALRERPIRSGIVPYIHYPLTDENEQYRPRPPVVDFTDEGTLKERIGEYRSFLGRSGDALTYAHRTFLRLVDLANKVRLASGLKSQMLTLTDKDITSLKIHRVGDSSPP